MFIQFIQLFSKTSKQRKGKSSFLKKKIFDYKKENLKLIKLLKIFKIKLFKELKNFAFWERNNRFEPTFKSIPPGALAATRLIGGRLREKSPFQNKNLFSSLKIRSKFSSLEASLMSLEIFFSITINSPSDFCGTINLFLEASCTRWNAAAVYDRSLLDPN